MNSLYFAIGCILIVLAIYWGSAETEPKKLSRLFGPRVDLKSGFYALESPPKKESNR